MSGGSYDYICHRMSEVTIRDQDIDARRAAFAKLFKLVTTAMHDIEWVDSGDYGDDGDHAAIDACFKHVSGEVLPFIYKAAAYEKMAEFFEKNKISGETE